MKTVTRGERERTILLLRCAADIAAKSDYVIGPGFETASRLGLGKREADLAWRASRRVAKDQGRDLERGSDPDEYIAVVLEAAQRLEDRSWP